MLKDPFNIKILRNFCFTRREWLESRKLWDWERGRGRRVQEGQWREDRKKESVKWVGKSIRKARRAMIQAAEVRRETKCRPYQLRHGSKALCEIQGYQISAELMSRKLLFQQLVREVAQEKMPNWRFQANALRALQEATESYLVGLMEDSNLCAIHESMSWLCLKICS